MSDKRGVTHVFKGRPATDGAGVNMTRVIATPELDHFDPFLLLDKFRSDKPGDYIAGFPDHPHRGFETVTYMLAGSMKHGDNQGHSGELGPGSVQWMTAARGIVHSEMPQQEEGLMWGFQLWVNLPASDKMGPPRYQEFAAQQLPEISPEPGVNVKIIAGEIDGVAGLVSGIPTEPIYLDVTLDEGASIDIETPHEHNVFVYAYSGSVDIKGLETRQVREGHIALTGPGYRLEIQAPAEARCLVIGGKPLAEPVARYGPFVMNTEAELRQAFADYQANPQGFGR